MVEQPAKVMRIGTMIKQLLEEVRAAPLDEASRSRLKEIHENSVKELEEGLAPELREELNRLIAAVHRGRHPSPTPSCGSRRPSWSAGWRGCSTASRRRCSPSRWPRGRSWSRCAAACRRVRAASSPTAGSAGARASTCRPCPDGRVATVDRGYPRSVAQAMTTGDAAVAPPVAEEPGPRSWRRAFDDLRGGWRQRPLWGYLGWQDIKQRYRRSVLGPLWISITHGRHRHGDGHPLRRAVRRADPDVPAVRRHRAC